MKLEWHFIDYPTIYPDDNDLHWSDEVLVKNVNGQITIAAFCCEHKEWVDITGERFNHSQVACWAYIVGVPETIKPMPEYRGEKI